MNQFLAKEQLLKKTVIYLPILFAVVFCVLTTRTYNFWDDETNGYYLTGGTFGELLKKMSHNIHEDPPLYNILQWIWRQVFGESVIALRSLSILFFILTLPIVFVFTRCLSSEESAIYALLFMCFSPFNLIFSPSARG